MARETISLKSDDERLARRWISALEECDKWRRSYQDRCRRIIRRYKNEIPTITSGQEDVPAPRRFAILWSNIQTLGPAVYARPPQPVVTRRYKDSDPVGRYASEVLERAISYTMDRYDLDNRIKQARDDYLLLAQGQVWIRYIPHVVEPEAAEEGEPEEGVGITETETAQRDVAYAEVVCDHVAYNEWGYEPCTAWENAKYVWRRALMDRRDLIERFGKVGRQIPLNWTPGPGEEWANESPDTGKSKLAAVYEIWDKTSRKVIWINRDHPFAPLDVRDDPLGLNSFFPCPAPLMGTVGPDMYLPVPDYVFYKDQAEELDELTNRIGALVDGLKMVGVYAGEENVRLQNLFTQPQGTLVPVESMASWTERGGSKGLIEWLPIEIVISTLQGCFEARKQILEDIYQITGMADIIRGASDPRETAAAQQLKGQWGSLRVRDRQKELARFSRDTLRLVGEVLAEHFPAETLEAMTEVHLLQSGQQKQQIQQIQQQNQQAQQTGQQPIPIPPEVQEMLSKPTWEEVLGLLRDDAMRSFRIDVETDSTIEPNEMEDKAARVEFVTAIGQLLGQALPVVQAAPQMGELIGQAVMFLARGFRVGREMEDVIETTFQKIASMPPQQEGEQKGDPYAPEVAKLELQTEQVKQQGEAQRQQLEMQRLQMEMPLKQATLQLKQQELMQGGYALQRDPTPQAVSTQ